MNELNAARDRAMEIIQGSPSGTTIDCLVVLHHIPPAVVADIIAKRLVAAHTADRRPCGAVTTLYPWRTKGRTA